MGREGLSHPVHHLFGLVQAAGQEQVTENDAAGQDSVFIQLIGAGLAHHFPDGGAGGFRVVGGSGVALGGVRVGVFVVGEIDLNVALQGGQRFHPVIAPAVPNHGDGERVFQGLGDDVGVVGGVHQVDVVGPGGDQLEEDLPQTGHGDGFAKIVLADAVVLAENAAETAPGEEDGPGPLGAGERRFLPMVQGDAGDHGGVGHPTAALGLGAVSPAPAGAEGAVGGIVGERGHGSPSSAAERKGARALGRA